MLEQFLDFFTRVAEEWGLVIVFVVTFLETSAMIGLIMPGEVTVLLAGALAAQGVLDIRALIVVVIVAAVLGDNVGYWVGRKVGRGTLLKHGRLFRVRAEHLERVEAYFSRHGGKTILFGRWIGFLRSLAPFVAGSVRVSYPRYLFYDLIGVVSWAVASCLLGFVAGESYQLIDEWLGRVSLFLLFIVLLGVGLWFFGRWLWRRRDRLARPATDLTDRVLEWQVVHAARRRFAAQISWSLGRFSPRGAYGLVLTAGLIIATLLGWLFALLFEAVTEGDALTSIDRTLEVALRAHSYPRLTQAMKMVTFFGGPLWTSAVTVVVFAVLARHRVWRDALVLATAMIGAGLLVRFLKVLVERPRPDVVEPLVAAGGYSFPSGHATIAMVLYSTLALLAAGWMGRWETRIYIFLGSAAMIALVGFSRLYLGVHYLSDVLAGFALGAMWVTLCVTAGTVYMRARESPS